MATSKVASVGSSERRSTSAYARFCTDFYQQDTGRRYRELAGLHDAIPAEDDLSNFRHRVGAAAIEATMAVLVDLFSPCGLITGDLVSTDGQLEPSYSRFKGCAYATQGCQQLRVDEASQQELCRQLQSGAKRLQLPCPFPEVVAMVRQVTAKKGAPKDPKVALLEIEDVPKNQASLQDRQQVATLLGLSQDQVPNLRLKWCHLRQGPRGKLVASCPKVPSDLEARVGYHIDTKDPSKKERVFGYLHQKTTAIGETSNPANFEYLERVKMLVCRLQNILEERGMSRRELARRSGLNINTVCMLANTTNRLVGLETLAQVCATLQVQPGELLVWETEQEV